MWPSASQRRKRVEAASSRPQLASRSALCADFDKGKIDGHPLGLHTLKLHANLSPRHNSILTQLRTGRFHLRGNLFKMCIEPSPFCVCGRIESREHFLLSCLLFALARRKLRLATKGEPLEVNVLLSNPLLIPTTHTYTNEME
mgnify:CR=1 FL=1